MSARSETNETPKPCSGILGSAQACSACTTSTLLLLRLLVKMNNVKESIQSSLSVDGAIGAAIGDWSTGFSLGQVSKDEGAFSSMQLEQAIALNSEVIKAKNRAREGLGITSPIEDILISLKNQYHLIRICEALEGVFFYMVMDREKANLGLARIKLRQIEQALQV